MYLIGIFVQVVGILAIAHTERNIREVHFVNVPFAIIFSIAFWANAEGELSFLLLLFLMITSGALSLEIMNYLREKRNE